MKRYKDYSATIQPASKNQNRQLSNFTSSDLEYYDQKIMDQRAFLDELWVEYYSALNKGWSTSAYDFRKRNINPAEETLKELKDERQFIIDSMEGEQSVEFNDYALDSGYAAAEPQAINWNNIGLVVGVVILIVVVYKIL